ncbi:hypothetical protein [Sutterella wadsworthensis]|uniref:hypothetical protein n=1 Tax=Sutterella wadsworthensis TaxID=40545 RepID=UPI003AF6BF3C
MLDDINRRAVFLLMGSINPRIYLHQLFMSMVMRRAVDIEPSLRETTGTASHSRYIENGDCVISLTMPGERAEIEWLLLCITACFEAIKRDRHLQIQDFSAGKHAD